MNRPQEFVTTLDHLEHDAEVVERELARLLDYARDLLRRVQDVEAEIGDLPTGAHAARGRLLYDLRVVGRQLMRAQAVLVPVTNERHASAVQALGWLEDAEREDRPWRAAA